MHCPRLILLLVVAPHTWFATETKTPAHLTMYEHAAWTPLTIVQCFVVIGQDFSALNWNHADPHTAIRARTLAHQVKNRHIFDFRATRHSLFVFLYITLDLILTL